MKSHRFDWILDREGTLRLNDEWDSAFKEIVLFNQQYFKLVDRFNVLYNYYKKAFFYAPLKWSLIRMYYVSRYNYDIALNMSIDNSVIPSVDPFKLLPYKLYEKGI